MGAGLQQSIDTPFTSPFLLMGVAEGGGEAVNIPLEDAKLVSGLFREHIRAPGGRPHDRDIDLFYVF